MCGNVSDDWVNEWASFFQSQLSKANYKNSIELNPWHYSGTNILAMTALTDTWGNSDQKAFLLGEWCKTMQNESLLSLKDYNQLPYHWSDRKKFIKDYEYLESFYERVLKSLADHLNKYHGTKHTLRYWRILLGPWLLTLSLIHI